MHTADLHLQEKKPETLGTLDSLIELAKKEQIDLLTIGGDLFDSMADAEAIRTRVRRNFSGFDFQIIAIPGNHDQRAFRENLDFGSNFQALIGSPSESYQPKNDEKVNIVGVPFIPHVTDELLGDLEEKRKENSLNILLLHCTLDISFSTDDFGENESAYFPINRSTLRALGYDFVLAGHFHTKYDFRDLGSSCRFVYPGSPISLTWKELGERRVAFLDTETQSLSSLILKDSFFRDFLHIDVKIGKEDECLQLIDDWVKKIEGKKAELWLRVDGIGELNEIDFRKRLEDFEIIDQIDNDYRCVIEILQHPLYELFLQKLDESAAEEKREQVIQRFIEAMGVLYRR
ncbi:MAG: exonuclease SbcCD subunit D [Candidatus Heimdallarchaeota archaeon]